jgi:hypothetical protein
MVHYAVAQETERNKRYGDATEQRVNYTYSIGGYLALFVGKEYLFITEPTCLHYFLCSMSLMLLHWRTKI